MWAVSWELFEAPDQPVLQEGGDISLWSHIINSSVPCLCLVQSHFNCNYPGRVGMALSSGFWDQEGDTFLCLAAINTKDLYNIWFWHVSPMCSKELWLRRGWEKLDTLTLGLQTLSPVWLPAVTCLAFTFQICNIKGVVFSSIFFSDTSNLQDPVISDANEVPSLVLN